MPKKPAEKRVPVEIEYRDVPAALTGCRVLEANEDEAWDFRVANVGMLNVELLRPLNEAYGKADQALQKKHGLKDRKGNLQYREVGDSRILQFPTGSAQESYEAEKEELDHTVLEVDLYQVPLIENRTFLEELEDSNFRGDLGFLRGIRSWILPDPEAEEDKDKTKRRADRERREAELEEAEPAIPGVPAEEVED